MMSRFPTAELGIGTPRALILYGRSRGVLLSLAGLVGACALLWWLQASDERSAIRQTVLVQAMPALIASVIGISVWSPFGEPERTAARSLPQIRLLHLATLVLPALLIASLLVVTWTALAPDVNVAFVVVRNITGLTGVALLCGRVIDARLTWLGPMMWVAFSLIGTLLRPLDRGDEILLEDAPWWAWTAQTDASGSAWGIALALGLAGAALLCRYGPRDTVGEEE